MQHSQYVNPADVERASGVRRGGDAEAFSALYEQHARYAYRLALTITRSHALAADAFQEGMIRVWRALPNVRPGNMRSWILRVVARECLRLIRSGKRERMLRSHAVALRSNHASDTAERESQHAALCAAVAELAARDRDLVQSCFDGGLSQRRISAAFGIPQQTVSYRMKYIVNELRTKMTPQHVFSYS